MLEVHNLRYVRGASENRSFADSDGMSEARLDLAVSPTLPKPSAWRLLMLNRPEWHHALFGSFGAIIAGCEFPLAAFVIGQVSFHQPAHAFKTCAMNTQLHSSFRTCGYRMSGLKLVEVTLTDVTVSLG